VKRPFDAAHHMLLEPLQTGIDFSYAARIHFGISRVGCEGRAMVDRLCLVAVEHWLKGVGPK
jgi:hypothetical protein